MYQQECNLVKQQLHHKYIFLCYSKLSIHFHLNNIQLCMLSIIRQLSNLNSQESKVNINFLLKLNKILFRNILRHRLLHQNFHKMNNLEHMQHNYQLNLSQIYLHIILNHIFLIHFRHTIQLYSWYHKQHRLHQLKRILLHRLSMQQPNYLHCKLCNLELVMQYFHHKLLKQQCNLHKHYSEIHC